MLIKFETTVKESAIRFRTIKVEGLADELVPIADGDNPELLLHSLDRFNWLIKTVYNDMEVDDAVNRYTHCLGGTYYREWIRTEQNEDLPNVYSFEDYQKSFLRRIFDPEERENLIDLIMNPPTKKPKQTVAQYCARLEELRVYAHMLGSCIMQEGVPVAYYSRKLNSAQANYTTMEKELLSIVETFKEYRTMLLGAVIRVHTDHRNLTFTNLNSQRVLRWRLVLEEFGASFHYIQGPKNVVADALSRVPAAEPSDIPAPQPTSIADAHFYSLVHDDPDFAAALASDCHFWQPGLQDQLFPLTYPNIAAHQQQEPALLNLHQTHSHRFPRLKLNDTFLICYLSEPDKPWKICLPAQLITPAITWYHTILGHCGSTRLLQTLSTHFYNPSLRRMIDDFVAKCSSCQQFKNNTRRYGHLAPREARLQPWDTVAVDLIGPWTIPIPNQLLTFNALTCIDTTTNYVELIPIANKTSMHIAFLFETEWLARYPRPLTCIHDQGPEFTALAFQNMLHRNQITSAPISVKNPQSNGIVERLHQTIGNALRTQLYSNPPLTLEQAQDKMKYALSTAAYATRVAVHRSLGVSPGAMVFLRDMVLNIPLIADLEQIRQKRQVIIDDAVRRQNLKRTAYDYQPGQQVLLLTYNPDKLQPRASGPYDVVAVHVNGTLTIQRLPNVTERINIRRVKPYTQDQPQ